MKVKPQSGPACGLGGSSLLPLHCLLVRNRQTCIPRGLEKLVLQASVVVSGTAVPFLLESPLWVEILISHQKGSGGVVERTYKGRALVVVYS